MRSGLPSTGEFDSRRADDKQTGRCGAEAGPRDQRTIPSTSSAAEDHGPRAESQAWRLRLLAL